jgi:CHAD domain-containing protein
MNNLEGILEIAFAIRLQKRESLPSIVEKSLNEGKAFTKPIVDESARKEDNFGMTIAEKQHNLRNSKEEKKLSYHFTQFSEYLAGIKSKFYEYASKAKSKLSHLMDNVGYKDRLLNEIEDWGVVYFKTTFSKLARLSPIGASKRYLEKLWICVSKSVK